MMRQILKNSQNFSGNRRTSGRVDDWRCGGRTWGVAVAGGFRDTGASIHAMAPFPVAARRTGRAVFPHPALSETSCLRPRQVTGCLLQTHQSQRVVEELVGVALRGPAPALVLDPQPSTQPTARMGIHGSIRRRHRAEAVVPPPARQHPVQPPHQRLGLPPLGTSGGQAADRLRRPPHTSLRRPRAHIGPPRLPGVAPSDGVTQKLHALVRNPANRAL